MLLWVPEHARGIRPHQNQRVRVAWIWRSHAPRGIRQYYGWSRALATATERRAAKKVVRLTGHMNGGQRPRFAHI
jgi:hypothetical protein